MRIYLRWCAFTVGSLVAPWLYSASVNAQSSDAPNAILAKQPPMGWNSWDSYGLTVTETEFRENTNWLAKHLKPHGWEYVVVDEGWYLENPEAKAGSFRFIMDADGRYIPAVNRFPSANPAGFKPLADWVHNLGLKFGLHIIRGIPREAVDRNLPIADSKYHAADAADKSDTCPWNSDNYGVSDKPAGQAYYDSVAKLYASWGVDFVKIDCIAANPYKGDEIRTFSEALRKTGRPIVLSLSPGPAPLDKAKELRRYAQMWRISGDVWDHWKQWPKQDWSQGLLGQFDLAAKWAPNVVKGHWPDADMLPIGYLGPRPGEGKARNTDLTRDEQRTLITLWSVLHSPLVMGGNLTRMDEWTTSLLVNEEVLRVDQSDSESRALVNEPKRAVWTLSSGTGSRSYLAVFNLDDQSQTFDYKWTDLSFNGNSYRLRDLWERKDLGTADRLKITLRPHASSLYELKEH